MSQHWHPDFGRNSRQLGRRGRNTYPARRDRGRLRLSFSDLWLMVTAGIALGLGYAAIPGGAAPGGAAAPDAVPAEVARSSHVRVIDGDTFDYRGQRIRIADIDTPETHQARCAQEAALGEQATRRLEVLLAQGPFELEAADQDEDRYGRKLRIVSRGGESLGAVLVSEGLARPWTGRRMPWCA